MQAGCSRLYEGTETSCGSPCTVSKHKIPDRYGNRHDVGCLRWSSANASCTVPFLISDRGLVQVQYVVLGELLRRRGVGYGYELREQLREVADVLGYSDTYVYAALDALERHGLVEVVEGDDAPPGSRRRGNPRVYYRVTEAGATRHREWMTKVPAKAPLREDLHMILMTAESEDLPELIPAVSEFEEQCRAQLRRVIERPLGTRSAETQRGQSFGAALVQDGLIAHLQTTMEWAQRTRATLQRLAAEANGVSGRHHP